MRLSMDPGVREDASDGGQRSCDPLIDEVRAVRRALCEQFGNDVDRLCGYLRGLERQHPERVVRTDEVQPVARARR